MPTYEERLTLLERMADQQLNLNDQLLTLTNRLGEEHARYQERLAWHDDFVARLDAARAQHAERMDRLETLLQAIKDLLERGDGH